MAPPPVAHRAVVFLAPWAIVIAASACGEDPRIARRATALDVAGTWLEQRGDPRDGAIVEIATETDLNDVVVTISGRVIDVDEAAALDRVGDAARREALVASLVLGAGRDAVREESDGGENVSFDLGETTTVQVVSTPVPVAPSSSTGRDAMLTWALRLDGDAAGLEGHLEVLVREAQPRPGDDNGVALVTTLVTSVPLGLVPVIP